MKIVKKGNPQTGWAKEFTCTGSGNGGGGCEARLLVERGDVYVTESHSYDETDRFNTFTCPDCGVLTDIGYVPFSAPSKAAWEKAQQEPPKLSETK